MIYGGRVPRVSVIIPAYNSAATIEATIASIAAQTFEDWEIVVGDDASTDDTAERARAADPRVTVVTGSDNGGPAAGRNLAIGVAQGELLALLDADDRWLPDYLEAQVGLYDASIAGQRRVGIVACDAYVETPDGTRHGTYSARVGTLDEPITLDRLLEGNPIFVSALVPRALVTEVGGFSTETWGSEDHDLWLRIVERGYEVAVNARPLVVYREAEGSVSASRVGMARTSQATYRRALERGRLSPRQARIARRNLRLHRAVETLERVAERRADGDGPGIGDVPALARSAVAMGAYGLAHPRRWGAWARALSQGRVAAWRPGRSA